MTDKAELELRAFFGRAIRTRREELGLSGRKLGTKTRLGVNHVGEIERGQRSMYVPTLFRIADGLDMTATALVERVEIAVLVATAAKLREPRPNEVCREVQGQGFGWAKGQIGVGVVRAPITYGRWERGISP